MCASVPGYSGTSFADHPGDSIGAPLGGSPLEVAAACDADCSCRGFNSAGVLKASAALTQQPSNVACFYTRTAPQPCESAATEKGFHHCGVVTVYVCRHVSGRLLWPPSCGPVLPHGHHVPYVSGMESVSEGSVRLPYMCGCPLVSASVMNKNRVRHTVVGCCSMWPLCLATITEINTLNCPWHCYLCPTQPPQPHALLC